MKRSRGSKRGTTPAAETQPAVVVEAAQLVWVRFCRAHVHDRVQRVTGERIWVAPETADMLVDRLGVATRVDD